MHTHTDRRGGKYNRREGQTPTCLVVSEYIDEKTVKDRLPGWEMVNINRRYVDFIYCTGSGLYDGRLFSLGSKLKPRLNSKDAFDKGLMHEKLMDKAPLTIASTINMTAETIIPQDTVWIVKANFGSGGMANYIVTNQEEAAVAYDKLQSPEARLYSKDKRTTRIIASEYIRNPLLYNNRKFHLRVMVLVLVKKDGTKKCWMMDDAVLIPAKKEYTDSNYDDKEIHDTHFANNPFVTMSSDLPNEKALMDKVANTLITAMTHILPQINKYKESENGYDAYGADIMFTENEEAKLLEINRTPSLDFDNVGEGRVAKFAGMVLDATLGTIFKDIFPYKRVADDVRLLVETN